MPVFILLLLMTAKLSAQLPTQQNIIGQPLTEDEFRESLFLCK